MPGYTNPQNLNRYSYVLNNPLRYTDPTGHMVACEDGDICEHDYPSPAPSGGNGGGGHHDDDPDPNSNSVQAPTGGGGTLLLSSYLNTDYYQLMTDSLHAGPVLPPSPFACGWFDCALSAVSTIMSALTMTRIPEIAVPAGAVDLGVTFVAIIRTNNAHSRGEISDVQQWALNGTGLAGLIPFEWGFGFSAINTIITIFGFPYP